MAMPTGIQGQLLEITVVGCNKLRDTEWISRQDPYVCLEYANNKFRTRTCTDGGRNPTFNEKFSFSLIEGLREVSITVWNSNTLSMDDFIGSGSIKLNKVLSEGYDDTAWSILSKRGKYAGEVRLIMHCAKSLPCGMGHNPTAPTYSVTPSAQYPYPYGLPPTYPSGGHPAPSPYPSYPPASNLYAPNPYPPPPAASYPPPPYPQQSYPPPPPSPYPPPGIYPPSPYGPY